MRKRKIRMALALICVMGLLLSGCGDWTEPDETAPTISEAKAGTYRHQGVPDFEDMTYTRPDMDQYAALVQLICTKAAAEDSDIDSGTPGVRAYYVEDLTDSVLDLYDAYDSFYTMESLANIHYSLNLRDTVYQAEYDYCIEQESAVEQGLEDVYRALAASPLREDLESESYFGDGFFDSYDGDSFWTQELSDLTDQENQLITQCYAAMGDLADLNPYSDDYCAQGRNTLGPLLVELVKVRQELASYLGYDSYGDFAFDYYYGRDYSLSQAEDYLERIRQELTPLYRALNESDFWYTAYGNSNPDCLAYLQSVTEAVGGKLRSAYTLMTTKHLYDITPSSYKYNGSFEIYLTSYSAPFIFLNPAENITDCLSLTHEFGHFASDYFSQGSSYTTDVAEIFSQGLEYLSLCYAPEDTPELDTLRRLKLADSLNTYVEQAAYAKFECELYAMDPEELTADSLNDLYNEICREYGFDSWNWQEGDWFTITHFFTSPYYIMSYVTSNDAAMQLYEMELSDRGAGLQTYTDYLSGGQPQFMAFVQEAGLQSPFDVIRLKQVRNTLETGLDLSETAENLPKAG